MATNEWAGTCCREDCEQPSEWPGKAGNVCQNHWESESSASWWEYVRALDAAVNHARREEADNAS
jgi:hypothetical protein